MKQIVDNLLIDIIKFDNSQKANLFLNTQLELRALDLEETYGDNYYCFILSDSLTLERRHVITFFADSEDDINLLFWYKYKILIINIGNEVYLIKNFSERIGHYSIQTPLVGLSIIDDDCLLILEECSSTLISPKGDIIRHQNFSFIENFYLRDNTLILKTDDGEVHFSLEK